MEKTKEIPICPTCKTGLETLLLDRHTPFCPHIDCHKDGDCRRYEPLCEDESATLNI